MKKTVGTIATTVATALICILQGGCFAVAAAATPVAAAHDTIAIADCNWNHPGANPFMGDLVAAVDRYQDIAPAVRARLQARMAKRDYDEVVEIRRDRITGRDDYGSDIADMHFGTRQLCHRVTRSAWTPQMQERGLVYCEGNECILVPTVCRNVSRIQRRADHGAAIQSFLAPALAAFAPAAGADEGRPERAGPIGWAPGGMVAGSPAGVLSGATGPVFASAASVGQAGGLGEGRSADGLASAPKADTVAYARQSARVVADDTDRPTLLATTEPAVIAAPVPEPETWVLMAVGLLASSLKVFARRRSSRRRTTQPSAANDGSP